jgi:predicted AlkP superfamily pyrophosphatase or phosphodiesterase
MGMTVVLRGLKALLFVLVLAGCASQGPGPAVPPKLIVFMVVDGFPQRQLTDYRDQLAPDGLRRFLDRGMWFADAHYGHAFTVTAAGHAVMLTGAYPHRTGILGNDWRDPATGEIEYCTGDAAHAYIGNPTNKLDGTSPKNLKAETVGDVLKRRNAASKVIAVSGKDRGAILPAGKTGTAYMFMNSGEFASSTYYMKDHPQWVKAFNAAKPADRYFHADWSPLLPEAAYERSLPDNQKWFAKGGSLPKKMGEGMDKPGGLFYRSLLPTPFGDALTLDFARAAIRGEQLGRDEAPDLLSISLSGHDYINHAYGAESRLSHDHVLHLDRLLQAFFRDLDAMLGKDSYLLVMTADHGFMPAPEYSQGRGLGGGRQSNAQMLARMNAALAGQFGEGRWVKYTSARSLVLDHKLAAERKVDLAILREATRRVALEEPAIQVAYTRIEIESGSRKGEPFFEAMQKSFNRELSGDVEFALKPYWMFASTTSTTTHGSPHPYDTNVPMLFYGPSWVKAERVHARAEVIDIAPTLSAVLGVPAPSTSEGRVLPLR